MSIYTIKEKKYYPYDPGGAIFIKSNEKYTHFFQEKSKTKEEFFEDIDSAYFKKIENHPDRLLHMTGAKRIPVTIHTVIENMKLIGYQEILPTFVLGIHYGYSVEEYYTEEGIWTKDRSEYTGEVVTSYLNENVNQPSVFYRLTEYDHFMDYDEGGEFSDVRMRLFDFTREAAVTKEEFFFHVSAAREMADANNINELVRILCEDYDYKVLCSTYLFTFTEGEDSESAYYEDPHGFNAISHETTMDLMEENVPFFDVPKKKITVTDPEIHEESEDFFERFLGEH